MARIEARRAVTPACVGQYRGEIGHVTEPEVQALARERMDLMRRIADQCESLGREACGLAQAKRKAAGTGRGCHGPERTARNAHHGVGQRLRPVGHQGLGPAVGRGEHQADAVRMRGGRRRRHRQQCHHAMISEPLQRGVAVRSFAREVSDQRLLTVGLDRVLDTREPAQR